MKYWERSILFGDWIYNINQATFTDVILAVKEAQKEFPNLTNDDFLMDGEFMRIQKKEK